ncbi:hypothetical protein HDK77DRAFT_427234 [Phyllosticta capitalensis]
MENKDKYTIPPRRQALGTRHSMHFDTGQPHHIEGMRIPTSRSSENLNMSPSSYGQQPSTPRHLYYGMEIPPQHMEGARIPAGRNDENMNMTSPSYHQQPPTPQYLYFDGGYAQHVAGTPTTRVPEHHERPEHRPKGPVEAASLAMEAALLHVKDLVRKPVDALEEAQLDTARASDTDRALKQLTEASETARDFATLANQLAYAAAIIAGEVNNNKEALANAVEGIRNMKSPSHGPNMRPTMSKVVNNLEELCRHRR